MTPGTIHKHLNGWALLVQKWGSEVLTLLKGGGG